MAIYEVVLEGLCWGQQMQNRFHYSSGSPGTLVDGAQDVADVILSDLLLDIRGVQRQNIAELEWTSITTRDLYDDTDFGEIGLVGVTGLEAISGQAAPPFVSTAYRSPRFRTGRNRAYKRFAGIPEGHITGNTYSGGAAQALLEAGLIAQLVTPILAAIITPRLLFLEVTPGTPPTYALFPTEASQRDNMARITTFDFYRLTTQRSRIVGHGP